MIWHTSYGIVYETIRPKKPVRWVGSSLEDLRSFPEAVQDVMGYALYLAQCGERHRAVKPLRGPLGGIMQVTYSYRGNAYRMVYTSKFSGAVYVLHAFQKKAKQGIATPRTDVELIQRRNRLALEHHQGKGE